jgi:hypothetical protein
MWKVEGGRWKVEGGRKAQTLFPIPYSHFLIPAMSHRGNLIKGMTFFALRSLRFALEKIWNEVQSTKNEERAPSSRFALCASHFIIEYHGRSRPLEA